MPEAGEVDLDKVREAIDEELEREGGGLVRLIALTTALFAAIAAIVSLQAGSTVNEALVLKSEATQLQAQASDQWAYYQAKGIKGAIAATTLATYAAVGRPAPDSLRGAAQKYAHQQDTITTRARALERQRDERSREAEELLHHHHLYADAVALLQVAIALGAVAALTRKRPVLALSVIAGLIGTIMALVAALR